MLKLSKSFLASQSGVTSIEYSLIAAMIAMAIIGVVSQVGQEVQGPFTDATTGLQKRVSP